MLSLRIPDLVIVGEDRWKGLSATLISTEDRSLRMARRAIVALAPFGIIGLTIAEEPINLLGGVPHPIDVLIGGTVGSGTYRCRASLRCETEEGNLISNWADFVVEG